MIRFFLVAKKRKVWSGNIFAESEDALRAHLKAQGWSVRSLRTCHAI